MSTCDVYSNESQKIHTIELSVSEFDELNSLIQKEDNIPLPFENGVLSTFIQYTQKTPKSLYLIPLINMNQPIGFVLLTSEINDTHGHIIGDIVLKSMVERIMSLINKDSLIGRYGGEEFIIIHHSIDPEAIHRLAHDILFAFRQVPISIHHNEKTLSLDITISIGLASSEEPMSVYELTNRADSLLYNAKKNGKNQICSDCQH